jgi:hypothetical protein
MLPDAQSLIRRSGAAAPLLGGKPLNAGDAVRSVIDQLMATPPTPAASQSPPAATPAAAPTTPSSTQ